MPYVEQDKKDWVVDNIYPYLGEVEFRIGPYSRDKQNHYTYNTDILIDDNKTEFCY